MDDGARGGGEAPDWQPVDQQKIRRRPERRRGAGHGEMGCPKDVEAVDLSYAGASHPDADPGEAVKDPEEVFAAPGRELLGVRQPLQHLRNAGKEGQDHAGRHHGAGERAASSFIKAGHALKTGGERLSLEPGQPDYSLLRTRAALPVR